MANWKEKGYVPDSDSDEDSQNSTGLDFLTTSNGTKVNSNHDVQERQENEASGEYGEMGPGLGDPLVSIEEREGYRLSDLGTKETNESSDAKVSKVQRWRTEVARDVFPEANSLRDMVAAETSPRAITFNASRVSSPLSEVPSSLPALSDLVHAPPLAINHDNGTAESDGLDSSADLLGLMVNSNASHHHPGTHQLFQRSGRNLRHRKAIQLHPYVIEKEKFDQSWRSRGLKPVYILQKEAARTQEPGEDDTQNFELSDHENMSRSSLLDHTMAVPFSQVSLQDEDTVDGKINDDIPDVPALFQHVVPGIATDSRKRRKLNAKFRKASANSPINLNLVRLAYPVELEDHNHKLLSAPLSAHIPSESHLPYDLNSSISPQFRQPPRMASPGLPTPLPSSEPKKRESRGSMHGADKGAIVEASIEPIVHVLSDAGSSSDEDKVSSQLKHAQRRIKGVLPASWLKLDLMAKPQNIQRPFRHVSSNSPQMLFEKRGVARPIPKKDVEHSTLATSRQGISAFSERGNSDSDAPDVSPDVRCQDYGSLVNCVGEAIEDDSINAMLPTVKGTRTGADQARSRQKKFGELSSRRNYANMELGRSWTPRRQRTKLTSQSFKIHEKSVLCPPRLSVLDFCGQQAAHSAISPSFVKIAMRTARSRHDRGRHRPSQKHLQLATREETKDLHETMEDWRGGTITPICVADAPRRQPLRPRSSNTASPLNFCQSPVISKQNMVATGSIKSIRKRPRASRPKNLQSSLENLIQRRVRYSQGFPDLLSQSPHLLNQEDKMGIYGKLSLGLQTIDDPRPAILESSQLRQEKSYLQSSFSKRLSKFCKPDHSSRNSKPVLDRFLHLEDPNADIDEEETIRKSKHYELEFQKLKPSRRERARKRRPKQMDAGIIRSQDLASSSLPGKTLDVNNLPQLCISQHVNGVQGLGPFGTRYTVTFDVSPLPRGVRFHRHTYLGGDDFAKSLMFQASYDLDSPRGAISIASNHKVHQWGTWNEVVATEIGDVFDCIVRKSQSFAESHVVHGNLTPADSINLLTAVISYFSEHLSFSDPLDRIPFLEKCRWLLSDFWDRNRKSVTVISEARMIDNGAITVMTAGIRLTMLGLILAAQVYQVSKHCVVSSELKERTRALVVQGAEQTLAVTKTGIGEFQKCLNNFRTHHHGGPAGHLMYIDSPVIEAVVVTYHIIRRARIQSLDLLEAMLPHTSSDDMKHLRLSEQIWQRCFTVLPFLEFNEQGALEIGRRFKEPLNSWNSVKRLISSVLEAYDKNPQDQASSFNEYCRTLFSRCLHLINGWGWYGCDSIIGLLFDFFAKNNLGHLRNEESHGSPRFLENLSQNPTLDAEPGDRCFHLLLKMLGSGLRHMQDFYPEKKLRDMVWRLMPNHGRSHPKEQSIRQEDLDALRNHHDLLCTLYWASPPSFRPSLKAIRTLVDLERSHREACHISIRAWFNLVQFQLSTDEPSECIVPFTQWHSDFLRHMLRQHGLARSEAEDQMESAQSVRGLSVSKEILESTILQNQLQVEAMLDDALTCLELAITAAKTQRAAGLLLSSAVAAILDGSEKLADRVVLKALNVLCAYARRAPSTTQQTSRSADNDDSQDYGDWSAFNVDDALDAGPVEKASEPLLRMIGPLRTLISNCFGADTIPEESFLTKLVDSWVAVGWILVNEGVKSYDEYLGLFGKDAWSALRDTTQTRKYAPYFFSSFIEIDARIFQSSRLPILACWLGSLVQCESLLKFEHKITSSILNANPGDPLLSNLPFWMTASTTRFDISAVEFSERRLSLISCVLSNMRTSLEVACMDFEINSGQIRQEYKDLLKHMMMTMKRNYVELAQDSNAKACYVDFVHKVVEYLQEHTPSICSVDRFFTDSATFPTPTYDPNYVVGQLRNFALRFADSKTPKQLAVFLQSVSERAAADGHQSQLVQQLHAAMSTSENGSAQSQLRNFVAKAIVPAYLQLTFENTIGRALAIPFLRAFEMIFGNMHFGLDGSNIDAVDNVTTIIIEYLSSTRTAMTLLIDRPVHLDIKDVLTVLKSCFESIIAVLPTLDYVLRLRPHKAQWTALNHMTFFKSFSTFVYAKIVSKERIDCAVFDDLGAKRVFKDAQYNDVFEFVLRELRNTLQNYWYREDDRCFISRGSSRRQVMVESNSFEEERDALCLALHDFGDRLSTLPALGGWDKRHNVVRRRGVRMEDELLMF